MIVTKVFRVDPLNPDEDVITECCREILKGAIVVFPTETVYGLGASAYNREAVKRIFIAKGRPSDNPLIVHISSLEHLEEVAVDIPEEAWRLAKKFWPGPLTMVLKKSGKVPKEVTAGLDTVAVRMPAHPVALKLISCSTPIAAPSANLSGRPSPTTPHHIMLDMYGRADIIIDAGETFFGVESTIINLTTDPPTLLRPGPLSVEKIVEVLGKDIVIPSFARGLGESDVALSPGIKYRHYAPKTKLLLIEAHSYSPHEEYVRKFRAYVEALIREGRKIGLILSRESRPFFEDLNIPILVIGSRNNLYEVAKNLFKTLREVDNLGVELVLVEGFDEHGIGLAIMNRLRKASGFNRIVI